jgi:ABC-2 type transport system permease protein
MFTLRRWREYAMLFQKMAAFLIRDFYWELSYPFSSLWRLGSILFHLITFYFLSRLVSQAASPYLAPYGGVYFPFAMVGLALASFQAVALSSLSNTLLYEWVIGHPHPRPYR